MSPRVWCAGKLTRLKHLFLNTNSLWDEIPESLGDLANLEKLHLNQNKLSGGEPPTLVCVFVCVCVCERERERERESVCVCLCVGV